jgi:hypothetical protein
MDEADLENSDRSLKQPRVKGRLLDLAAVFCRDAQFCGRTRNPQSLNPDSAVKK